MNSPFSPSPWLALLLAFAFGPAGLLTARADCTLTNTGEVPLPELGLNSYAGYPGGLYPHGANNRPPGHLAAGLLIATNGMQPRDASGAVNTSTGKIVLLSSGMSNTTQEWASKGTSNFRALANADNARNPKVVIVDGAIGGQDAKTWTNINSANWQTVITQRLAGAGVTTNQVQAMWLKQATAGETGPLAVHAAQLESYLEQIVRNAKILFPNLQAVYLSSRTRAYVYGSGLNPEPYAFETAFAVKWLIEKQISGAPELNFDPARGPVRAPYLSWGPYLWADGWVPRSDGFTWLCSDLETDFTHPSATGGVPKVAGQLLAFFKTDPTATPWFLKPVAPGIISCTATASVASGSAPLNVDLGATAVSSSAPIRQYAWTFDDGEYAYGPTATKVFRSPGTFQVRVTATDTNGNTATAVKSIAVSSTFAAWRQAMFSTQQLTNSLVSGPAADPDADQLPNLLEYALGTPPLSADSHLPTATLQNGFVTFAYPHYKPATDVALTLETSTNLLQWSAVTVEQASDEGSIEQLQARLPVANQDVGFFRLRATSVP